MKALLIPGQGKICTDLLLCDFPEKQRWFAKIEERLRHKLIPENALRHDVYSGLILGHAFASHDRFETLGGKVAAVAGYSVGQYAALGIAGVLDKDTCLDLALARARLMRRYSSEQMGMLGVMGLKQSLVVSLINRVAEGVVQTDHDFIAITNYNSEYNVTIGGSHSLLARFTEAARAAGAAKIERLDTQGAWHSRMLAPASDSLRRLVASLRFQAPSLDYVDNVTGKIERNPGTIAENLITHLTSAVRWDLCIDTLANMGTRLFLECGAGGQLCRFLFFSHRDLVCQPMSKAGEISECAAL